MSELLPCPFCGGTPVRDGRSDDVRVRCEGGCKAVGQTFYFDSEDDDAIEKAEADAIAAWNRRAPAQPAQEPVAWRDHVEHRIRTWKQRHMNKSGDLLALEDFMGQDSIDDLVDFVCDEWAEPVERPPAALPGAGDLQSAIRRVLKHHRLTIVGNSVVEADLLALLHSHRPALPDGWLAEADRLVGDLLRAAYIAAVEEEDIDGTVDVETKALNALMAHLKRAVP